MTDLTFLASPTSDQLKSAATEILFAPSVAATQLPAGTGDGNKIQVEFGPAQGAITDDVMIDVNGVLTFNKCGLYWVKVELIFGRTGSSGESEIRLRTAVNGVPSTMPTTSVTIDSSNIRMPYSEATWVYIPDGGQGSNILLQLARDAAGNNSGGLYQDIVTLAGWNQSSCATVQVFKF